VEQIGIGTDTVPPSTVRRGRIHESLHVFVPIGRCLCCRGLRHDRISLHFIAGDMDVDWGRRYESFDIVAPEHGHRLILGA
jgi:hypothetical protein